jgi:flagellar biosynthetic protein FliO
VILIALALFLGAHTFATARSTELPDPAPSAEGVSSSAPVFLNYEEPIPKGDTSYFSLLMNFAFGLAFTILVIFLVKKFAARRSLESSSRFIKLIDFFNLTYDKQIVLVEILGRYYVLGVTSQRVNLISEIADKETIDKLKFESDARIKGSFFSDYLKNLMPGGTDDNAE